MTTKWSSYRGVPMQGHLYVADQQEKKKKFCLLSSLFTSRSLYTTIAQLYYFNTDCKITKLPLSDPLQLVPLPALPCKTAPNLSIKLDQKKTIAIWRLEIKALVAQAILSKCLFNFMKKLKVISSCLAFNRIKKSNCWT